MLTTTHDYPSGSASFAAPPTQDDGKDTVFERVLANINEALGPVHDAELSESIGGYPSIFVTGPLRSGTTLLSQLCIHSLDVGYISNLAASFWRAPVYGAHLQRKLLGDPPPLSFQSNYGRTADIREPHEFSYFWNRHLGYRNWMVDPTFQPDWRHMQQLLDGVASVFARPVVYKAVVLNAYIPSLVQSLRNSMVVVIRRDPVQTAASILEMRVKRWGSKNAFGSMRPPNYQELLDRPYWEQIAAQVRDQWTNIDEALRTTGETGRVLHFSYRQMCGSPSGTLSQICDAARDLGIHLGPRHPCPPPFEQRTREPSDDTRRLHDALLACWGDEEQFRVACQM